MGIVGMYRPSLFASFSEEGLKMVPKEEYIENARKHWRPEEAEREEQQTMMMVNSLLEVAEDGKIYAYYPIAPNVPKEDIDAAIAQGEATLAPIEGYLCFDKPFDWKEEDGVYKYDTRQHREIFGEIQSSWDDLKFDGRTIQMSEGLSVYEKVEE